MKRRIRLEGRIGTESAQRNYDEAVEALYEDGYLEGRDFEVMDGRVGRNHQYFIEGTKASTKELAKSLLDSSAMFAWVC